MDPNTPSTAESAFQANDVEDVVAYHTLSVLAIVALLFGLASPLYFASGLFLMVPLIGIAMALVALQRIAASDGVLSGRAAAMTGLALCVACIAAVLSRDALTQRLRTAQAEEFGRNWLAVLASGEKESAFRLTIDGARPTPPPPEPGMPTPPNPYDAFLKDAVIQAVAAAGADAKIEVTQTLQYERQPLQQFMVRQQYSITPAKASGDSQHGAHSIEVILTLQRSRFVGSRDSRWLVKEFELPATAANASTG